MLPLYYFILNNIPRRVLSVPLGLAGTISRLGLKSNVMELALGHMLGFIEVKMKKMMMNAACEVFVEDIFDF